MSVPDVPISKLLAPTAAAALLFGAPAAAQDEWRTDFSQRTVDLGEIVSGGPAKDGIPAIDAPQFVSVSAADRFLADAEPVAVVRRGGQIKAYPLQILIWHEIVNDVVGGDPVSVTYCPLCNTTLAFDRRHDGRVLDFGTTGRLRHSDLVMYDRQTESWWQQATGEGIVGELAGERLTFVSAPVMRWQDVREQLPTARVLSRETGFPAYRSRYGRNPYAGYDRRSGPMAWTFGARLRGELDAMERVVALGGKTEAVAIPFSELRREPLAQLTVEGRDVVVFFEAGTASAVDAPVIAESRSVGSSAVYDREVAGRRLTFEIAGAGAYRDLQTGSTWNLAGRATAGPLEGRALREVPHGNHFWFAWAVFCPETTVWRR